ncbi:MAG: FAD-dependent oxidoreductase, partial [Candidatus Aenigmarchaeota archaeon]|nr:FAD-dependent oxidoreductase [Candidatus Aenigmarchaeota archaeon]
ARHVDIEFPGHKHASLYDAAKIEPEVYRLLMKNDVKINFQTRINLVKKNGATIESVTSDEGEVFTGDVFVDCTG